MSFLARDVVSRPRRALSPEAISSSVTLSLRAFFAKQSQYTSRKILFSLETRPAGFKLDLPFTSSEWQAHDAPTDFSIPTTYAIIAAADRRSSLWICANTRVCFGNAAGLFC